MKAFRHVRLQKPFSRKAHLTYIFTAVAALQYEEGSICVPTESEVSAAVMNSAEHHSIHIWQAGQVFEDPFRDHLAKRLRPFLEVIPKTVGPCIEASANIS